MRNRRLKLPGRISRRIKGLVGLKGLTVFIGLLLLATASLTFIPPSFPPSGGDEGGGPISTPGPVSDDEVNAIARKLYCPICENTPLDVCPTQACKDWRALIRQQLGEGWTEPQIVDYFVANYGLQVLAQPPLWGFSALVWILPLVGLAGGGVFLWRVLRRWQERHPPAEPVVAARMTSPADIAPDLLARIEGEVKARY